MALDIIAEPAPTLLVCGELPAGVEWVAPPEAFAALLLPCACFSFAGGVDDGTPTTFAGVSTAELFADGWNIIPEWDAIPSAYEGDMGVPKTFIDKYCPEQFEIIGIAEGESGKALGLKPYDRELKKLNKSLRDGQLYYMEDGMPVKPYARILIRKRRDDEGQKV